MSCRSGPRPPPRRGSLSPGDTPSCGWASAGSRLQPFDELILVFRGAVDLAFLGPALQPRVDFRRRDAALLRDSDDVLVVRDAFGARELVDDVADRDDLLALRLTDAGLDDVYVEAAFLAGHLAHPVPDGADGTLRDLRADGLAEPEPGAGLGKTDDRLELPRGDRDAGARRLAGLPDLQIFLLDDLHGVVRHHGIDPLRIGHVLAEEDLSRDDGRRHGDHRDRKSTRLNSSHLVISYAVFCLKKKSVVRSEEHTSELQSPCNLVCRLLLEKKKHAPKSNNIRLFCWT